MGEQVLPHVARPDKSDVEEEDRRMIEEVRQMSLREVGVGSSGSRERTTRNRGSDGHGDSRAEEARRRRRRDHDRRRRNEASPLPSQVTRSSPHGTTDPRIRARQIEHQSSLRSLISSSDFDSSEIDEELLRQIIDEILQDGVDLDNLNAAQEDELTDRIATALRQGRRPRPEDTRTSESRGANNTSPRSERDYAHRRRHGRSSTAGDHTSRSSHPPVSSPQLLHAEPPGQGRRRRTSNDHRRQTSPGTISSSRRLSEANRSAPGTATDAMDFARTSNNHRRQSPSSHGMTPTMGSSEAHRQPARSVIILSNPSRSPPPERGHSLDASDRRRLIPDLGSRGEENHRGIRNPQVQNSVEIDLVADSNPRNANFPPSSPDIATGTQSSTGPQKQTIVDDSRSRRPPYPSDDPSQTPITSTSPSLLSAAQPSWRDDSPISCNRCNKSHLEHKLHYNCPVCLEGNFNLCLRCYRQGLGCLYWFGFGHSAAQRYERQAPPEGYPPGNIGPHVLIGHLYIPFSSEKDNEAVEGRSVDQPARGNGGIWKFGAFCSKCAEFADQCYWKCDVCNEGEWGFCDRCVNKGNCCSHPLLPMAHTSTQPSRDSASQSRRAKFSFAPSTNAGSTTSLQPRKLTFPLGSYAPLTFSNTCAICKYPIPPSTSRFHCPQCNDGDYDICTACYFKLTSGSRISAENGPKGWRRCLNSHRMIVVGFEDSLAGQRRVIVNDLVGGHALKDDVPGSNLSDQPMAKDEEFMWRDGQQVQVHTITRPRFPASAQPNPKFPPDGGFGMRVLALWSYWPEPEAVDELEFPKGAVVSEVENINGDWFWGVYAGTKGLFPGNHVRILEDVVA